MYVLYINGITDQLGIEVDGTITFNEQIVGKSKGIADVLMKHLAEKEQEIKAAEERGYVRGRNEGIMMATQHYHDNNLTLE